MEVIANIQLIDKGDSKINNIALPSGNKLGCNNENALEVLSEPYIGDRPYLNDISLLESGDTYCSNNYVYKGFISEVLSGDDGEIMDKNAIVVSGLNINHLIITFDQKAMQWATKLSVNEQIFTNVGPQYVWQSKEAHETISIKILEWNTPNHPFRITGIFTGLTLQLDNRCIKDCVRGSQCVADNTIPKFGVLSGYGSLTIYDIYGEFEELAEMGIIKKGSSVKIFIDDITNQIGDYIIVKWNYDVLKKIIKIDLKERIELLEQYDIVDIKQYNNSITLKNFMLNIAQIYKEYGFILSTELPDRLNDISYGYVNLSNLNCKTLLEEICKLHGIYAMQSEIGEIVFIDI